MDNLKISLVNNDLEPLEIRKIHGKYEEILRLKVELIRKNDKAFVLNKFFKNENRARKWSSPLENHVSMPVNLEVYIKYIKFK